ncbi:uncharacterized protein C3orf38 homolog [Lepisosteus oculatus]|uniref:uncharacterized protein C3orf38 homolog n=1 Tax=Lepisosteus oculatus TaxID=7918 RepID=UPI0035F512BF
MSGLSEKEKEGCSKILKSLSEADLLALNDTVTNRRIAVENIEEAQQAILIYSQNAEELLKRKKVQRDVIFSYLVKEGVVVSPAAEKHLLIKRTLEYWRSDDATAEASRVRVEDEATSSKAEQMTAGDYQVLAKQFCQWFFQLLNSQNPTLGQTSSDWGPQHFWEDARLKFCYSTGEQQEEEYQGAQLTSLRLLALAREEQLLFSPNLEPQGLKWVASPHGLVVVAVAGTIHRHRSCLGIFEQVFGLIRAPMDNSWKIKFVNLKILGKDGLEGGGQAMLPTVTYEHSDLQLLCG